VQRNPVGVADRSVKQISCLRADDRVGAETASAELLAFTADLRDSTGGAARAVGDLRAPAIADEEVVKHALEVAQGELVGPEEFHRVHHRAA
jgi:hypothetical protein